MTQNDRTSGKATLSAAQQALLQQRLRGVAPRREGAQPIPRRGSGEPAPLSLTQKGLWFLNRVESSHALYTISNAIRLRGALNVDALERALNEVVRRHEILRTRFREGADGQPVQIVEAPEPLPLLKPDLSTLAEPERLAQAERLMDAEARRPLILESGPLVRAQLLKLADSDHWFVITIHHIIFDGWSEGVLMGELATLYQAFASGEQIALPELPVQYGDFSAWQQSWATGADHAKHIEYWRGKLAGVPEDIQLPTDRPRSAAPTMRGGYVTRQLSAESLAELRNLSQQNGATLFMTLLAAFKVLLARYAGQEDIVVGTPVAGRSRAELEKLIGFFVNMLVLRTDASGNPTFEEWTCRVRDTVTEAMMYGALPFDKLVEELRPLRVPGRNPIFQVGFVFQGPAALPSWNGLTASRRSLLTDTSKFDLTLFVTEDADGLKLGAEYSSELFNESTIRRMLDHFAELLSGVVANPKCPIGQLPLLTESERRQLVVEYNQTKTNYPRTFCIHELFEAQAQHRPDATALVFGEQQVSYRSLNERANRLAHSLLKLGVNADTPVGICMERSIEMVVALLAILKTGGAYLPLDPEQPRERLAFMLADTKAPVLLTQRRIADLPAHTAKVAFLDARDEASLANESASNPPRLTGPENLAYVIYTSGSTGTPKGTLITHRGVVRLVRDTDYASFGPDEVFLQFAPLAFDASTFEIWGPLLNGGKLVIMPPGLSTLEEVGSAVTRYGVTTLWLTAGLFHVMVEERVQELRTLRQLLAGGDVLSVSHVKRALRVLPDCRIINGYGPTENTTFTCCHTIGESDVESSGIPIGRPISNTMVYVLDRWLQPVPIGVPGELYIGGDGLARDYLNRAELSRDKFIPNAFVTEPGARLYKTGDICRWRADGIIEFLGRRDHQVKVRGFRIELEEIEAVLNEIPGVRASSVIARGEPSGNKRLVAYIAAGAEVEIDELRRNLRKKLPEYMVPAAFVRLDKLPLTPNGKVDRRALPGPDRMGEIEAGINSFPGVHESAVLVREDQPGEPRLVGYLVARDGVVLSATELREHLKKTLPEYMVPLAFVSLKALPLTPTGQVDRSALPVPCGAAAQTAAQNGLPQTPIEEVLAATWAEVLGLERVGVHDNFFAIGGHSLLTIQILDRLGKAGLGVTLEQILRYQTVAELAAVVNTKQTVNSNGEEWSSLVTLQSRGKKPPFFLVHTAPGDLLGYMKLVYCLGNDQPIYGFQSLGLLRKEACHRTLVEMAAHYVKLLRQFQPRGPYHLGGWCFGGNVAMEMARQLAAQGQQVALLALIETWAHKPRQRNLRYNLRRIDFFRKIGIVRTLRHGARLAARAFGRALPGVAPADVFAFEATKSGPLKNREYVYSVNMRATRQYRLSLETYPGRVTLFFRENYEVGMVSPEWGFEAFAQEVETRLVPGDHRSVLKEPHVQKLADEIRFCLERAQKESSVRNGGKPDGSEEISSH